MYNLEIVQLFPTVSPNLQEFASSSSDLTEREMSTISGGATISGGKVTINANRIIGEGATIYGTNGVDLNAPYISLPNSTIASDPK